ncbi:MAG: hypothetical protein ACI8WT_000499 [Clostridium sp.]|jgi:hypothetical protein
MKEEELLYDAIFPEDNDPNYINYGYFIGRSKRSIYKLRATINESQLNPILICDGNNENAFFAKVFQSEVDCFLKIANECNFKQSHISCHYINQIKCLFGEAIIANKKKAYKASHYLYPQRCNNKTRNLSLPDLLSINPANEHQPNLNKAI